MSLERLSADLDIIQKLDDEPNDVGGMTSEELKEKFDESGNTIKVFLNENLIPTLEECGVLSIVRSDDQSVLKYIRLSADKVLETSADGVTWEATGSSGHVILDQNGVELPQRSRMQFTNGTVEDKNGVTVITGVKGDTGPKGDTGATGERGETGPQGKTGPSVVPSVDENGVMSFTVQDTATAPQSVSVRGPQGPQGVQGAQGAQGERGPQGIQGVPGIQGIQGPQGERGPAGATGAQGPIGPQGPRGDNGADGKSFVIQDIFATIGELKAVYPTGNEYAYQVTGENNEIFIWSEKAKDWSSVGNLQGPVGPQGPQGVAGPQGIQGVAGPQGIQGVAGPQGATGPEGPQGPAGVAGQDGKSAYTSAVEGGYTGTETAFNAALSNVPAHIGSTSNPHNVTKAQVGLGNVDNTSDSAKPVSTAQATAIADAKKAGTDAQSALNTHKADTTIHVTAAEKAEWSGKQEKLIGAAGQVVGFDENGHAIAQDPGMSEVFFAGASEPDNTKLLWIDTTETTGGLKYYNGTAWAHVPVAFA